VVAGAHHATGERLTARLVEENLGSKTSVEVFATPRRLAACQPELVDRQEDRDETIMGPPVSASFDAEGHPTNAGLGFARKLGVTSTHSNGPRRPRANTCRI